MIDPARWTRIEELFHEACILPADTRARWLAEVCGADAELRREVEALVAAHEGSGPVARMDDGGPSGDPPLEWIGPYRLMRRLGEGGMGVVYLAEREGAGFTQTVALKLLRAGFADPRLGLRLAEERRILARLEHPGIARLIDGAATPGGQPYFAMEYVEGDNLLDYCDDHELPLRRRLRLFIEVCEAVDYAHRQLVVHRDLKPGNILVTADGRPKLLDFGVAKLLEEDPRADATQTAPWVTPAYVSPEQLRDGRVSTLTDVYALGVVLYELLTGRRPYDVEGLNPTQLAHVVCETIPPAPSEAVTSGATFATSTDRLRRRIAGDLDVIVLKALAKEPDRRYHSAEQLAEDLRRYLSGEPVLARPDTVLYRASKFVRRHKASVTAVALVVMFLVGGSGVALWQAGEARAARRRAEGALQQSQDVTGFLLGLFEASDPDTTEGDTVAAREILRRGVTEAERLEDQPAVQARMFDVLGQIYQKLGQYDEAGGLLARAEARRRAIPDTESLALAQILDHRAMYSRVVGEYELADSLLREALRMKRRVVGPEHPEVAETLRLLGFLMPYMGQLEESEAYYREALAVQRRGLPPDDPRITVTTIALASILMRRARNEEAEALYREAVAMRRRSLGPTHPDFAVAEIHLADFLHMVRGAEDEAEALLRDALGVQRRVYGERHNILIHGMESLANVAEAQGRFGEAEALLRESLAIREERRGPVHASVAEGLGSLANFLHRRGRLEEAEEVRRREVAMWRETLGEEHHTTASALIGLAVILTDRGKYAEAARLFDEGVAMRERVSGPTHGLLALALAEQGRFFRITGRYPEAEASLARALSIVEGQVPDSHPDARRILSEFVALYERWGRDDVAKPYRERFEAASPAASR